MECVKVDYKEFEAMTIQHSKDLLQAGELRATSEIGRDEVALNGLSRAEVEQGVLYHAQGILEEMGLENEVELLAARVHGSRSREELTEMILTLMWCFLIVAISGRTVSSMN